MANSSKPAIQKIFERFGFEFGLAKSQAAIVIAVLFLAISFVLYKQYESRKNWIQTTGTLSSVTQERNSNNQILYSGVVTYGVNGQSYSIQDNSRTILPPHIGKTKNVSYNPQNPTDATVKLSSTAKVLFIFFFPICGSILLVYALVGFALILRN